MRLAELSLTALGIEPEAAAHAALNYETHDEANLIAAHAIYRDEAQLIQEHATRRAEELTTALLRGGPGNQRRWQDTRCPGVSSYEALGVRFGRAAGYGDRGSADGSRQPGRRIDRTRVLSPVTRCLVRSPAPDRAVERRRAAPRYTDAAGGRTTRPCRHIRRSGRDTVTDHAMTDMLDHRPDCGTLNRYDRFSSRCRSINKLITCAWIDLASADTGSSATMKPGSKAQSARAIDTRCRCPPEN